MQRPDSPATLEDGPRKDKGYRRYASNVERALSLFDTALQEWADYIAFLGRLLKALQSRPSDTTDIPHKAVVAKRLAQCLAPMLPSGVHQKTLEVYVYVFSVLGNDGLSRDLPLWLPGLSPTLSFASLSVKPALLSLFETFVVPLNPSILRSALKAIVLALLPGLEEESSEEFERTLLLLNKFRSTVSQGLGIVSNRSDVSGDQYFWQSLFLASITSSSRRQGALAYLLRELPRLGHASSIPTKPNSTQITENASPREQLPSEIEAVTSPEPGLLIRCFAAGLQDEQLLIQRGFLDLLVTHLPLHSTVFHQRVVTRDLELLVISAASVVARREMSLNRRLWTWFLGPQSSTDKGDSAPGSPSSPDSGSIPIPGQHRRLSQTDYFQYYGQEPLISGILKLMQDDSLPPTEIARPFRICLSLMDRWEIGGLVVPRLFLIAMECIWRYQGIAPTKDALAEVLRSASVFFDGVESSLIWSELTQVIVRSLIPGQSNRMDPEYEPESLTSKVTNPQKGDKYIANEARLDLILFIITKFNVREEEMLVLHIPLATLALLISLRFCMEATSVRTQVEINDAPIAKAFQITVQLLDTIPQRVFAADVQPHGILPSESRQMLDGIQRFYEKLRDGAEDVAPPLENHVIGEALLHNAREIITGLLGSSPIRVEYLDKAAKLLEKIHRKAPGLDNQEYGRLMSGFTQATERLHVDEGSSSFATVAALVSMLEIIKLACTFSVWESDHRVRQTLSSLLNGLWKYTSPSKPTHNVEAVRCLWRLHRISPDSYLVEGSIATLISQGDREYKSHSAKIEGARRFATIWAHSQSTSRWPIDRGSSIRRLMRRESENVVGRGDDPLVMERPLLLLLDSLFDPKSECFTFIANWLQSLTNMQKIIEIVIHRLHVSLISARLISCTTRTDEKELSENIASSHNVDGCLYYLQTISNLLQHSTTNIWDSFNDAVQGFQKADIDMTMSVKDSEDEPEAVMTTQQYFVQVCMRILHSRPMEEVNAHDRVSALRETAVLLLQQLFLGPSSGAVAEMGVENPLIETLLWAIERGDLMLQVPLMDLILIALRKQPPKIEAIPTSHRRQTSRETFRSASQISLSTDRSAKDPPTAIESPPPPALLDCLMLGISSPVTHSILEHWIQFMDKCLPFYAATAFQTLMPLVDCFIKTVESVFHRLQVLFEGATSAITGQSEPIAIVNGLLNGLEQVLARGHDQMLQDEGHAASTRSPEQIQGFFGNMVSGVFTPETQKSRSATANNRLTVLLCFKDAVRVSFGMWSWGDVGLGISSQNTATSASFHYASIRLRNRTRRILEHLFTAEALECLETLVELWHRAGSSSDHLESSTVFNLLHALEGSRPKNTIPALFNAIYSRTNPNVLDPVRKSTLTSELSDVSLATFLAAYTRSMEDDALDEIWTDCMTFLRDVLGNPLPHRQTLPKLLEFTAILGEKINNTNFGEQRKMRRDIGELFVRLLAATFTIKPLAFSQESPANSNGETDSIKPTQHHDLHNTLDPDDVVTIIASILPNISKILVDADRITAATVTISTHILVPTLRWKSFPRNVTSGTLDILKTMSRIPEASKTWKKDVAEAFNDSKFFYIGSLDLVHDGWMPVLRQWVLLDKDRMPDLLSRLTSPASAGIMFGVGASSARLEADQKTQLNLRRVAFLILSADHDAFIVNLSALQDKLVDLMTATAASSPSSTTRAEVYMVLRALILKTTPVHLASLWPIISTELYEVLSSLSPTEIQEIHSVSCVLQAAKLLDTLLLLAPDDFQLREWLFVTDTIDAVYRPSGWRPVALVDGLAEGLDTRTGAQHSASTPFTNAQQGRKPLLTWDDIHDIPKDKIVDRVLRPFLRQLSISTFESMYRMEAADDKSCSDDLLHDLFDETTLV